MIPVFEPVITEADVQAVMETLRRGEISGSFGTTINSFERAFADYLGVPHAVAVSSGTAALHVAVRAAGIQPGDEVLVSSSTNIATALAVVHNGAIPVPVDSEPDTWNLDLDVIESLITPKTRAILPVHLFGTPVDMDALMTIADRHGLIVIEDVAEALGTRVRGRLAGTFGKLSCFSFYANKVITTGEGGMVVTSDADIAERLRLLRNLGFTTPRFKHDELGFNYRMTGLQAALGLSQLGRINEIVETKRSIARHYHQALAGINALKLSVEPEWALCVPWMFSSEVRPDASVTRDELMLRLHARGIDTRTFFCPMNQQPALQRVRGFVARPCPVADQLWQRGLYLPSSLSLTPAQICEIGRTIKECLA